MDADIVNNDNETTQDNNNNLQAKTYTSKQYRKKFQNPTKQDEYQPLNLITDSLQQVIISSSSPSTTSALKQFHATYSPHRHSPSSYKHLSSSLPAPPPFPLHFQNNFQANTFSKHVNFNRNPNTNYTPSAYNRSARYARNEQQNQEQFSHSPTNRGVYANKTRVFTNTNNEISQENALNESNNNTTTTTNTSATNDLGDSSIVSILSSSVTQTNSSNQTSIASSSCSSSTHQSPPHDPETSTDANNDAIENKTNGAEPVVESNDEQSMNNQKANVYGNQNMQPQKFNGQRRHFNSLSVSSSSTNSTTSTSFHSSGASNCSNENKTHYAYTPQAQHALSSPHPQSLQASSLSSPAYNQSLQSPANFNNYYYNQNPYQAYQNNNVPQFNNNPNARQAQLTILTNNNNNTSNNQHQQTPIQQSHMNQMPVNMNQVYYPPPQPVMGQPFVLIDPQKVCSLTNNMNNLSLGNVPTTNTQYINLAQYPAPTATIPAISGSIVQAEALDSSLLPFPITNTNTTYVEQQHQQAIPYQQQQHQIQMQTYQHQFIQPSPYFIQIPNPNENHQQLMSPYYVSFVPPPPLNNSQFAQASNIDSNHQQHQKLSNNNNNNNKNNSNIPGIHSTNHPLPINQQYPYNHNLIPMPQIQIQTGNVPTNMVPIKMSQPLSNVQQQITQPMQQQMPYNQHYYHNYGSNYQSTNQFSPSSGSFKNSQNQMSSNSYNFRKKSCFHCRSQSHVAADCTKAYSPMQQHTPYQNNANSNSNQKVNSNSNYQAVSNENNSSGLSRESSDLVV